MKARHLAAKYLSPLKRAGRKLYFKFPVLNDPLRAVKISEAQRRMLEFEKERGWNRFNESQIFTHLIEEISEIGRHILVREGYKVPKLGHQPPRDEVWEEFGQAFSLFLQLANRFGVDLEEAFLKEMEIMKKRFKAEDWRRYFEEDQKRV